MPYIGRSTDGFGVRNRFLYLASASDTSVSGADANGATLTFTDGAYVDVYLNGVLLKAGTDYNTNTANTIAGLSALASNDEVTVIVYDVFTVGDMVSATSGGTFSGAITFSSTVSGLDVNGTEIILDADGDTTITADTDDQIDIKIAGADDFQFTANTFTAQSGSTIAAQALTATTITTSSTVDVQGNEIILDDDGDTSITADTDDEIHFKVAGSDHVKIKGGTNVLHVIEGSSGQGTPHTNSGLVIESDGETGINILTGNTNFGGFVFGDDGDADIGFIQYKHDDNYLRFGTNTSEQMRIDSSGNVGVGNTSPSSQYVTRLVVGDGSGTEGITIYSGNDSMGRLEFSDATSGDGRYAGGIVYEHNNNKLRFNTNGGNERMSIDSNGYVLKPTNPMWWAHDTSNNNSANTTNDAYETFVFDSETYDIGGGYNTSNGRYVAPVAGKYYVSSKLLVQGLNSNTAYYIDIAIFVNGAQKLRESTDINTYPRAQTISVSGLVHCDASDYIEVKIRFENVSNQVVYAAQTTAYFQGFLVG